MTSLAPITLKRERKLTAELQDLDLPVEVNDVTACPCARGSSVLGRPPGECLQ